MEQGKEQVVTVEESIPTTQTTDSYSKDFVSKLMTEKKNWAEKAKTLEMELKQKNEQKMLEEKRFEELAAQREKELKEWQEKHLTLQSKIKETHKTSELKKELLKLGIDTKYLDDTIKLADISKITYDDETGIITGAEHIAKSLQEKFSPLFGVKTNANHQAPSATHTPLSLDDFKKLSPEDKKKFSGDIYAQLGIPRTR
jgi:hypothetical protein